MPKRRLSSAPALVRGMSEPLPDLQANNSLKRSRTIGEDEQDFKGDFSGLREFHDVDHRLLNHDHSHHERPPHSFRRSRRSAASVSSGHNSAPLLESLVAHISLTEDPESLPYLNLDPLEDDQYSIINGSLDLFYLIRWPVYYLSLTFCYQILTGSLKNHETRQLLTPPLLTAPLHTLSAHLNRSSTKNATSLFR